VLNAASCIMPTGASRLRRRLTIRPHARKHSASSKMIGRHFITRCLQKRVQCSVADWDTCG